MITQTTQYGCEVMQYVKPGWEHRRRSGTFNLTSCNMSMFRNALSITPGGQRERSFHSDSSWYSIYSAPAYIQVLENTCHIYLRSFSTSLQLLKDQSGKGKSEVIPDLSMAEGGTREVQRVSLFLPPGELMKAQKKNATSWLGGQTLPFHFHYIVIWCLKSGLKMVDSHHGNQEKCM